MPADTKKLATIARSLYPKSEVSHLGTGGFASTFKIQVDADVFAVKILDPERTDVVRTEREFSALRRVSHQNVVSYRKIDSIEVNGVNYQYVEMDYIDGSPLSASFKFSDKFEPAKAAEILVQVLDGAAALWQEDTAHRDLSPNNIMITSEGKAVIVDLGMARHVDDETHTLLPTPGTPGWMSPEQVGANPQRGDWRSDQFVIGLLGWRLMTSTRPFGNLTGLQLWEAPGKIRIRKARDINPQVPGPISDVLERMTNLQPFRRFLNPAKLIEEANRAVESIHSGFDSVSYTPRFYVTVGQVKNLLTPDFLGGLGAKGLVLDAAQCQARYDELAGKARSASMELIVDPISYLDRSPLEARSASYKKLAYGERARLVDVIPEEQRSNYCHDVVKAQLDIGVDKVIAPYFLADGNESRWVDESLACARSCRELLETLGVRKKVWSAIAVTVSGLAGKGLEHLLNALTAAPLPAVYLLINTSQPSFAPLAEESVLRGIRDAVTVCREIGTPVIVGRRDVSGLLALSLGATGWSTGTSGVLENLPRHPEEVEERSGGQAADWYYVPELLNSIKIVTHARLKRAGLLTDTYTKYDEELFKSGRTLAQIATTEQRIILRQHNLQAKSDQVEEIAGLDDVSRLDWMREKVAKAKSLYARLPGIVDASESGKFLASWEKVL